jgi:hypothetical protein
MSEPTLLGQWTYRSFINTPAPVGGDAQKALALFFGEGLFTFAAGDGDRFGGTLAFGPGVGLTLDGERLPGEPEGFTIVGRGVDGTPTAGWRYDYHGVVGFHWPDGVDQIPSLLGTVIRVNPHGGAPAGFTASFVAVRKR